MKPVPATVLLIAGTAVLGWLLALIPSAAGSTGMPLGEFMAWVEDWMRCLLQALAQLARSASA